MPELSRERLEVAAGVIARFTRPSMAFLVSIVGLKLTSGATT